MVAFSSVKYHCFAVVQSFLYIFGSFALFHILFTPFKMAKSHNECLFLCVMKKHFFLIAHPQVKLETIIIIPR